MNRWPMYLSSVLKKATSGGLIVATVGLLALIPAQPANAEESKSKAGRWELFGVFQQINGDTTTGPNGIGIEVEDTFVGGVGFGKNYSDYVNLHMILTIGSTDVVGRYRGITERIDSDIKKMEVNVDVNLLKYFITPVVSGGIGWMVFSNDVANVNDSNFSYNLGAGVRLDLSKHFFAKVLYQATWTKLEDTNSSIMLGGIACHVGRIF